MGGCDGQCLGGLHEDLARMQNCYAETNSPVRAMEVRIGEALQVEPSADGKRRLKMWGPNGFRYETANWEAQLRALNRKAQLKRMGDTRQPAERIQAAASLSIRFPIPSRIGKGRFIVS